MITQRGTETNEEKMVRACDTFRKVLSESLRRGFFGTVNVEVAVQDGTIQHIRRRVDRIEK